MNTLTICEDCKSEYLASQKECPFCKNAEKSEYCSDCGYEIKKGSDKDWCPKCYPDFN